MMIIFLSGSRKEASARTAWTNSLPGTPIGATTTSRLGDGLAASLYKIGSSFSIAADVASFLLAPGI